MPVAGAIAERVQGILPVTWDALTRDPRYGDGLMRQTIDYVKDSVFGEVVAPEAESVYPMLTIDYAAKLAALEIIPAGIDFWMNEPISESATGTNENHSFTDRAAALRQLRADLLEQTRLLAPDIQGLLGYRRVSGRAVPLMDTIDTPLLTPDPTTFPRPFAAPRTGG